MIDDGTTIASIVLWAFDELAKEPSGQKMLDIIGQYKPDVEYCGMRLINASN